MFKKLKKEIKQVLCYYNFFKKNRRAQIGETLTWIVATLIIIILLTFFVYSSSLMGKAKKITLGDHFLFSENKFQEQDLLLQQSVFAYSSLKDKTKQDSFYELLNSEKDNFYSDLDSEIKSTSGVLNG